MPRLRWYLFILLGALIIAIIHGFLISPSVHIFISWLFIGFWVCFTIKFLQRVSAQRDLNSPLNTGFFVLTPLLIGLLYSFNGYFTGLLEWNIFGNLDIYLSPWILFFAFPYLLYGSFSLYSCCTRYDFVYIGQKPFNARRFGIFLSIVMLLTVFLYILYFYSFLDTWLGPFPPVHTSFDLMLLILCSFTLYLIIRYGFFGTRPNIEQISTRISTRRQRRPVDEPIIVPGTPLFSNNETSLGSTPRSTGHATRSTAVSSRPHERKPRESERKPKPAERKPRPPERQPQVAERKPKPEVKPEIQSKFKKLRPVAGVLSLDDFKCIFCFKLPQLPADQGRAIILCPNCKHPAHADEFKNWLKTSTLCSRCDGTISASFRRNPEIIRMKDYVAVIKAFYNKLQKKVGS